MILAASIFMLPPPPPETGTDAPDTKLIPHEENVPYPHTSAIISHRQHEPQFIVPHHPNDVFEGRKDDLDKLDNILQNPQKREKGNASASVSGISGSGKTHLVRQYVYEKRNDYPGGIFWVESMSSATIRLGYWKLAVGLGLTDRTRFIEEPHHDFFIQLVIDWFKNNSKWLLVLDGADHETDEEVDMLKEIIPGGTDGAIIITTVNKQLAGKARLGSPVGLSLTPLETADCVKMLFKYARVEDPTEKDQTDARELVGLMDLLPLAIHSAGSAMRAMQMDLGGYLKIYKKQPNVEGLISFHIVLDQLQKRYKEASNLIYILSFVERKVPVAMLEWGTKGWTGPALMTVKNAFGLNSTLGHLLSYSLIDRKYVVEVDGAGRVDTLLVHKVVQDICRLRMEQEGTLDKWLYFASKMFCKSFRRMERRRRDREFSVSDYRRFQVHISKILDHANAMEMNHESLVEMEETLTRIRNAIKRYTPKYGSQSTDDGDREYSPPKSQFTGSFSSLDDSAASAASASETMNAEIVYAPDVVVESPLDSYYSQYPFLSTGGDEYTSPTIRPSDSANRTPSPGGISAHPFGLPSGSPPVPPPLQRQFILGLTPRVHTFAPNNGDLPYPPSPGGPTPFPSFPNMLGYSQKMLPRNSSDPALPSHATVAIAGQASRSHGDLTSTLGRGPFGAGRSKDSSINPIRSRDASLTRAGVDPAYPLTREDIDIGMALLHPEGGKRALRLGDGIAYPQSPSSEPMSRSTSAGSVAGGVALPLGLPAPHSEPMSRRGSVGSVGSLSRYLKLSSRPIPTRSPEYETRAEREVLPEERKWYHSRQGTAPGLHVEDPGYDSDIDGIRGRVIGFGTSPPQFEGIPHQHFSQHKDSPPPSTGLSPAINPAEYLAASRRSSAPGAVQDPHHRTPTTIPIQIPTTTETGPHPAINGLHHYQHSVPPHSAASSPTGSLPLTGTGSIFSRSPSPVSILEAAGGAPMQRSISEPTHSCGAVTTPQAERERGLMRHGPTLRRTSPFRALGCRGKGKRYSPREQFLEYEGPDEPLIESWEEMG